MYKITNQTSQGTEILLYSLIDGGYTASRLIQQLSSAEPFYPITLRINSDGGDIFEAIGIYNYLKDKDVRVIIDGECFSAASIVAMCGKDIVMMEGSMFMLHNPMTYTYGDSEEMQKAAEVLAKITENVIDIYASHTSLTHSEIRELMDKETYMTPQEALAYGFCTEIEKTNRKNEEAASSSASYEEGVQAERERLQALDELYTPERAPILDQAKYKTFMTAQDIAIDLLKSETHRQPQMVNISNFSASTSTEQVINAMSDYIKNRRG